MEQDHSLVMAGSVDQKPNTATGPMVQEFENPDMEDSSLTGVIEQESENPNAERVYH